MIRPMKRIFFLSTWMLLLSFFFFSCASREKIVYLQSAISASETSEFETKIKPDDILAIVVSSENPEVSAPYNAVAVTLQNSSSDSGQSNQIQTYLVDKNGYIEFPVLKKIKLSGYTKEQAIDLLKEKLKDHVADASINLRILNYKITVLGEVNRPGTYPIQSERVTLLEALGQAGDLTIYGKRNNILIIREENGKKISQRVDITKSDFINSSYYYLAQNDVIYIEPNKTKINSSTVGPNIAIGISALSLVVTILALTIN